MSIDTRIRQEMDRRQLSFREVAEATEISESRLKRLAGGTCKEIKLDVLESLCVCLKCQPKDLLKYRGDKIE